MTERFGRDRKIRRSESANDQNASQIFGSNSAYSGAKAGYLGQTQHTPEQIVAYQKVYLMSTETSTASPMSDLGIKGVKK
jgi:hypothetical protein